MLVERDAALAQALRDVSARLSAQDQVEVVQAEAVAWLQRQPAGSFNLAFVDPPFGAELWQPALAALLPHLAQDAWLYVESPLEITPSLPPDWVLPVSYTHLDVYKRQHCASTSSREARAKSGKVGKVPTKRSKYGIAVFTWVCCSMISASHTR